jgi:hypothetical protein
LLRLPVTSAVAVLSRSAETFTLLCELGSVVVLCTVPVAELGELERWASTVTWLPNLPGPIWAVAVLLGPYGQCRYYRPRRMNFRSNFGYSHQERRKRWGPASLG